MLSIDILLVSSQLLRGAALFKLSNLGHTRCGTSLLPGYPQLTFWSGWRGRCLSFAIRARGLLQWCFPAAARLQWLSRLRGLGDLHLVVRVCGFSVDVVGIVMRPLLHLSVVLFPGMWLPVYGLQQRWCLCCKPYSPRPRLAKRSHWEQSTTCSHRYCIKQQQQQRSKGAARQRTMPES